MSFGERLALNETPVNYDQLTQAKEVVFGSRVKLLPEKTYGQRLMRPGMIVIHTDGQNGDRPDTWSSDTTYRGLEAMEKSVHFAVDKNSVLQMMPSYVSKEQGFWFSMIPIPAFGKGGAAGVNEWAISIEMAGREYDRLFDPKAPYEVRESIGNTTLQCLNLVWILMKACNISIDRVVGHNEISNLGKSDPGEKFMIYFRELLKRRSNSRINYRHR